jgi:hypothetical protein
MRQLKTDAFVLWQKTADARGKSKHPGLGYFYSTGMVSICRDAHAASLTPESKTGHLSSPTITRELIRRDLRTEVHIINPILLS